jgi:hypothetical protein
MRSAPALAAALAAVACSSPPGPALAVDWQADPGRSVALRHQDRVLWQFQHDPAAPHAFFHPLALPGTGPLTVDAPADHVWHHGLWFCWKFIDGVNYWEHARGADRPAGQTRTTLDRLETRGDGSATILARVGYAPTAEAEPVLEEARRIEVAAPGPDGGYAIDWTASFTAGADPVLLDRTPLPGEPGGQVFGGYAGLSLRLANLDARAVASLDGPQAFGPADRLRTRSAAVDYSGEIDGRPVGIAILAHPDDPRAPSPWYAIRSAAMSFVTPALLSEGPLRLEPGERLGLRYRVLVHPGRWDAERLAAELRRFVAASPAPVAAAAEGGR